MEYLKGHAVSLHRRESPKLLKAPTADDGVARAKLFKHAHLKVKEVVVRVTRSNQRSGRHWEPFHGDARPSRPSSRRELALILTHLRNLAVAYDNMTADEKRELTTVRELVVNLDWLCALAKHRVASDEAPATLTASGADREPAARRPRRRRRRAPGAPFAAAQPAGVARGARAPPPAAARRRRARRPTRKSRRADVAGPRPALSVDER
ncbi:hypothetical protein SO694_00009458 [Aureococcus anophagefferens]|uniref:Four helix bundle protein n=1 Tax=Aureococcus anophagefferens TaxID=44056 RepID=A0ABR1GEX4_AURAN